MAPDVEHDVDAVVADGVPDHVRNGIVLRLAVQVRRDPVVEREGVPREAPAGPEDAVTRSNVRRRSAPGRQMQERAGRAVDEPGGLVELEVAHVALAKIEVDARFGCALARLLEHRRRRVDPDHGAPEGPRDGDRDAAVPHGELDDGAVGLRRKADVERHVLRHRRRPLVVPVRERVVAAHGSIVR